MKKEAISTDEAPKAIGPYSQAVKVGNFVFCSGQIPLKADGTMVEDRIEVQTEQVLNNLEQVLKTASAKWENVVKTTIYLTDLKDFQIVNEIYGKRFKKNPPARATVQVSALPKGAMVEIDTIAVI